MRGVPGLNLTRLKGNSSHAGPILFVAHANPEVKEPASKNSESPKRSFAISAGWAIIAGRAHLDRTYQPFSPVKSVLGRVCLHLWAWRERREPSRMIEHSTPERLIPSRNCASIYPMRVPSGQGGTSTIGGTMRTDPAMIHCPRPAERSDVGPRACGMG